MMKNKGIWYDTPIKNRPVCKGCGRYRHGNQRHVYPVEFLGTICSRCFNKHIRGTKKDKNDYDKGWYLEKILENNPDFEIEEHATHKGGFIDKILTSTRFPNVKGQRIQMHLYFQQHNYFDLVEHQH